MAREYDVWVQSSNTVYKRVPFNIVTDWAQQGRLAATDKLRASERDPWLALGDDPILSDFLFVKKPAAAPADPAPEAGAASMDVLWANARDDEDDDVDMIPLIDISLVLLIFFMMTSAVSSLSPIDVPNFKNPVPQTATPDAVTVLIDKRPNGDAGYSLRIGDKAPEAVDSDLDTLTQMLARLDEHLRELSSPPQVRFACHRELPSERVHDLLKELEKRKKDGKIADYRAEVVEAK